MRRAHFRECFMFRSLAFAAFSLMLAACGPGGVGGARAPAHPSQSQATATGETRQIQIDSANRTQVETNVRDMLGQLALQVAPGATPMPGMEDVVTAIQPGTDHQFPVNLQAGTNYSFVGVCDADCSNIDLELLKGDTGEVVGSDLLDDDIPVVHYAATANGRYFVRLILRNCAQAPCYIGGRALQGAAGK